MTFFNIYKRMIHFGKTPDGELEVRLTDEHIAALSRMINAAQLQERRDFHALRKYIESEFK